MKTKQLPQGWNEVQLGEVLDYEQPTNYIVTSDKYNDEYETPVLTAGKSFILGHTNEKEGIYNKLPVIILDDFTTSSKFVTFPFKVKSSAMKLLTPKNKDIDLKFIFLLMQTLKFDYTTHKRYYLSKYQYLKIHLPPLKTQKAIVSILEKAEQLKEKRKKTIEYLDEYLKSVFNEMFLKERFEEKEISELCETSSGGTPSRPNGQYWKDGNIPWVKSGELDKGYIYNTEEKITELGLKNSSAKYVEPDSILIAMYGASVGKISMLKIKATTNQAICSIIPKENASLDNVYLFYFLSSIKKKLISSSYGGGQPNISQQVIKSTKIPLPSLQLQQKFASIVEHVEKLKEKQRQSLSEIEQLNGVLMQKAFRGELVR